MAFRPFISVFRIRFKAGLQYRATALAGIGTQFFFGFMFIMAYRAFYASSTSEQPMTLEQLASYMWLKQAFLHLIVFWAHDRDILDMIKTGQISYELCRPLDLYGYWFSKLFSMRVSGMVMRVGPIALVTFFLPVGYRLSLPAGFSAFFLFVATLLLGTVLILSFLLFAYVLMFYTVSGDGIIWACGFTADILTGQIIPVALLPDGMQQFLRWSPFSYVSDFSFRLYSGNILPREAFFGLGVQIAWIIVFIGLGVLLLRKGLKRVTVLGG